MKYSTLKYYAAGVCLFTGLCFAVTIGKSLWTGAEAYIHRAQDTDLYRVYLAETPTNCPHCGNTAANPQQDLEPLGPVLTHYEKNTTQSASTQPTTPKSPKHASRPLWESLLSWLVLALMAAIIFHLHWRLFRNLSAVRE